MLKFVSLSVLLLLFTGCYVATVETGLQPSTQVIKKPFASGWLFGLIPPSTVKTAAECPKGVAKVETQLSFVNMLVANITFGIYTPMQITVTCAESSTLGNIDPASILRCESLDDKDIEVAFTQAAELSKELGTPVYVQLPSVESEEPSTAVREEN